MHQNLESEFVRLYFTINLYFGMLIMIHALLQRQDFDQQTNSSAIYGPWTPRTLLGTLDSSFNDPRKMSLMTPFLLSHDSSNFPSLSQMLRRKSSSMNGTKSWMRKWRILAICRSFWGIWCFGCRHNIFCLLGLYILSPHLWILVNGAMAATSLPLELILNFWSTLWYMVLRLPPWLTYFVLLFCCCILTPMDKLLNISPQYCFFNFWVGGCKPPGPGGKHMVLCCSRFPLPGQKGPSK